MNNTEKELLSKVIPDINYEYAYNIRSNSKSVERKITNNVKIISKEDNKGIDIIVKDNTNFEYIYIPVLITESGLSDIVYNDFYIGKNSNVYIIAGCAIKNEGISRSEHNGIHRFFVEEGSNVHYMETHYAEGHKHSDKILNPITEVYLKNNSSMDMKSIQIKGVDKTKRVTKIVLEDNAKLEVTEKIMTDNDAKADTIFDVKLNGVNSSCHVVSRSFATGNSKQKFKSKVYGNNKCYAHVECDAILKDGGKVVAIPEIIANNVDANLIHEASIGKIAGEQLIKLMTLGLTEKEAEKEIIKGFLK